MGPSELLALTIIASILIAPIILIVWVIIKINNKNAEQ